MNKSTIGYLALFFIIIAILLAVSEASAQQSPPVTKPKNPDELEWRLDQLKVLSADKLDVTANKSGNGEKAEVRVKVKDKETSQLLLDADLSKIAMPSDSEYAAFVKQVMIPPKTAAGVTPMCGSIASVSIAQVGPSADYVVQNSYSYSYLGSTITVPAGFVFDRASIPRFLWGLISPDDLGNVAPMFHDYIYRHGGKLPENVVTPYRKFTREQTDILFRELMEKCGVDPVRRELAFRAVRTFSGFAWKD